MAQHAARDPGGTFKHRMRQTRQLIGIICQSLNFKYWFVKLEQLEHYKKSGALCLSVGVFMLLLGQYVTLVIKEAYSKEDYTQLEEFICRSVMSGFDI